MSVDVLVKALLLVAATHLVGCAHHAEVSIVPDTTALWRDSAYGYPVSADLAIPASEVFALDESIVQQLESFAASTPDSGTRFERLLDMLFGEDLQDFPYIADHTSPAAETWRNRGGNCISLAIMTLALTEPLGLTARIQEVRVPSVWQRRGDMNLLYRHINVIVQRPARSMASSLAASGEVVIDFDPDLSGSQRAGVALSRQRVLAMFYSNLAVEAMIRHDDAAAYANFHAAAAQDPSFESIWINLAHFYQTKADLPAAEQSLALALQLSPDSYAALTGMQQIMKQTGRLEEAASFEQKLAERRQRDPYFLYLQGLEALERGELEVAQRHFERAAKRMSGFKELHELLLRIYQRNGDTKAAAEQQRQLAEIKAREQSTVTYGPKPDSF